jgi:hypothetical protein
MLIWRGKGILVFLIAVVGIVIGNLLLTFPSSRGWVGLTPQKMPPFALGLGLLIAATCNFYFARYLDDPSKHRVLVDPRSNQTYLFKDRSSFMFVPVRYWTYVMAALGVLLLAVAIILLVTTS